MLTPSISEANQNPGSQTGSQRRQTPGDAGRHPEKVGPGSWHFKPVSRVLSIQVARSLHFLVLVWFGVFIVMHVTLVFTTGLLANLNHIYAMRDDSSWIGFGVFAISIAVMAAAWVAATPVTLRRPRAVQRAGYALIGPVQRLFEHADATPGEYGEKDISLYF